MKRTLLLVILLLMVSIEAALAQSRRVTGQVLDETGQGLPGAGINVKNTNTGTVTDVDGKFQLDVPSSDNVLVIQAIGYVTQEATITGNGVIVHMQPQARTLHETVVTALGIRRERKRVGYSVGQVDSGAIQKSGEYNVVEALSGKTSGVQVTSSAGTPGGSSKILLRGIPNIQGGNQPLIVIDGIPFDNSTSQPVAGDYPYNQNLTGVNESNRALDINPDDVESISVLKGPAAAALYGSSGANGAIMITTKKGKRGQGHGLGVNYRSSVELTTVNKLPKMQNQYLQGNNGKFATFDPGPDGLILTGDDVLGTPNSWGPRADTAGLPVYDKYKDFFKTGVGYTNNVAIDGGGEYSTFRLGIGNYTTTGIVPNSKLKRTNVTLSGTAKLSDWLDVGGSVEYINTQGQRVQNGSNTGGIMLTLLRAPINYNVKNYYNDATGQQTMYYGVYDNPLFSAYHNTYNDQTNRLFGNVYANAKLSKTWSINWKLGTDFYNTSARQVFDLSSTANDAADGLGQVNYSTIYNRTLYSDFILHYDKPLSEKFQLNAFVGYNFWYSEDASTFSRGRNLQVPGLYNLSNTSDYYASNTEDYIRTQGLFGDVSIGYNSLLYLTITGRNDWTTAFGMNGRSLFYPKADLSWIFSEHIPQNNFFSYGKARIAYSDAGFGPDAYTYTRQIYYTQPFITDGNTNGNSFPYLGQAGFAPSNINYPGGLTPADNEGYEGGLELHFWKNRISLEGTIYKQLSHNNLITQPIAPSSGYQYQITNAGEVQNKGIELDLNIDVLKSNNFQWSIGGNFTRNRSLVTSLPPGVPSINVESGFSDLGSYAIVGQPYGVFYGTAWQRDPTTGKILVDENGQAIVSNTSKVIGDPNPKWLMNIFNSFTIYGLNFSFQFDFRHGGDVWDGTYARLNRIGVTEESADRNRTYVIDGIYAPGTPNEGQQNSTPVSAQYYYQTFKGDGGNYAVENAIEDGSWVRLRSVNLSYRFNFRKNHPDRAMNYLELGVTGRNLWLHTKYKGIDPETSLTGAGSNILGYDYFNNPGSKSVMFSLRVGL